MLVGDRKLYTGTRRHPAADLAWALCLNVVILALLFIIMRPYFETNDDTALLTLINDAKITSDPHMVIASIFLGKLLMGLYSITHKLPWYTLTQYAMLFTAFTGVTYVLLRRLGKLWGLVLSAIVVLWMGYESYIVIQFSRTAGITTASALMLLFYAVSPLVEDLGAGTDGGDITRRASRGIGRAKSGRIVDTDVAGLPRIHIGSALAGILLILPGCWLRFSQFLPSAALMTGIGLWMLLRIWLPDKQDRIGVSDEASSRYASAGRYGGQGDISVREKLGRTVRLFLPFLAAGGLCLACRIVDMRSYETDPVWSRFHAFDLLREQLYDYGFPDYASNLDVYREAGISDAGYTLYRNWSFTDPDRFTTDVMEKLIAAKEPRRFSGAVLKGFAKEVPVGLIQKPVSWFVLLLLLMFLSGGGISRSRVLSILWEAALFGGLYLYLYYNGRYLRTRVDVPLLYSVALCLLWQIRPAGVKRTWWTFLAATIVLMAVPSLREPYKFRFMTQEKPKNEAKRREKFEQLSADPDHLYVMKMGAMTAHQCYGPFNIMPEKVLGNVLYVGGWAAYSHSFMDTMQAYGITNPFKDLIGNKKLYLVDNDIELTMTYLRENYDPGATYKVVKGKKLGKYKVYRILAGK